MKKTSNSTKKNQKTLVASFVNIFNKLEICALQGEMLDSVEEDVKYVEKRLGLNIIQSVMVAVMLNDEDGCLFNDFAHHLGINNIQMQLYKKDMDDLVERDLVFCNTQSVHGMNRNVYTLDDDFKAAICNNETFEALSTSDWSLTDLIAHVDRMLNAKRNRSISYDGMQKKIKGFIKNTQHLTLSAELMKLNLEFSEALTVLIACKCIVLDSEYNIGPGDYYRVYETLSEERRVFKGIKEGKNCLASKELMESDNCNGFASPHVFKLTDKAMNILLPEYIMAETESTLSRNGLIEPETVKEKDLFYNEQEQHQIDTLGNLLEESRFKKVQERLSERGMRTGFACLLYGGPGTGKTETVYQLARRTGRAIMPVNISEIRDKFVGETEKRIKHVFDKYRAYVQESRDKDTLCPILFFNEADAIISKRSENVERSVDKMENAMQNIILQEMENLDGILIATTNLTSNLDSAFERRFIYKIELSKPSKEVKSLIWQSMMPDLCEYDADELATSYDFSGGQIENVVRKQAINWVLYGKNASLEELRTICNEESISNNKTRSRIGFYA